MLAQVAATLRERQALRVGFNSEGDVEGGTIVLDENCSVSIYFVFPILLPYAVPSSYLNFPRLMEANDVFDYPRWCDGRFWSLPAFPLAQRRRPPYPYVSICFEALGNRIRSGYLPFGEAWIGAVVGFPTLCFPTIRLQICPFNIFLSLLMASIHNIRRKLVSIVEIRLYHALATILCRLFFFPRKVIWAFFPLQALLFM